MDDKDKNLRIAVISGIDKPATLESKGGVEVWTASFCIEEAARNRNIDLYGVKGSVTGKNINLIEVLSKPLPDFYSGHYFTDKPEEFVKRKEQFMSTVYTNALMKIQTAQDSYDIIIDSCSYPSFSFNSYLLKKPVLSIGHFPVDFATKFYINSFGLPKNSYFVFLSRFQLEQANFIPENQKSVIPNGINVYDFRFYPDGGNYIVWNSRVHYRMKKGLEEAMQIANQMKLPLRATGFIEKSTEQYFKDTIIPLESEYAQFTRQELTDKINKSEIFGSAKVFLFPIQWEEPYPLVVLETAASGTPIIAFARGSLPETVMDGVTGFLINPSNEDVRGNWIIKKTGIEGLREAVDRIYSMPKEEYITMRKNCRKLAEEHFTVEKMVDRYEDLYKKLLQNK